MSSKVKKLFEKQLYLSLFFGWRKRIRWRGSAHMQAFSWCILSATASPAAEAAPAVSPIARGRMQAHGSIAIHGRERGRPHQEAPINRAVVCPRSGPQRFRCKVTDNHSLFSVVDVWSVLDVQLVIPYGAPLVRGFGTDLAVTHNGLINGIQR